MTMHAVMTISVVVQMRVRKRRDDANRRGLDFGNIDEEFLDDFFAVSV